MRKFSSKCATEIHQNAQQMETPPDSLRGSKINNRNNLLRKVKLVELGDTKG